MLRHRANGHIITCPECDFANKHSRLVARHYTNTHKLGGQSYKCPYCPFIFNRKNHFQTHIFSHAKTSLPISEKAFDSACASYGTRFDDYKYTSIEELFNLFSPQLVSILQCSAQVHKSYKASLIIFAVLHKNDPATNSLVAENEFIFRSKQKNISVLSTNDDLEELIDDMEKLSEELFDGYCDLEGSGWTFEYVSGLFLELSECAPLTGGCPINDFRSKYVWDGNCEKSECFYTAVARHFHDRDKTSNDQIRDYARKHFPDYSKEQTMCVSAIGKFEKKHNLKINVVLFQNGELYPIRVSKSDTITSPINLLMISSDRQEDETILYHYIYITDLPALISELRYSLKRKVKVYACINCLNYFSCMKSLQNHEKNCHKREAQNIRMPNKDDSVSFSKVVAVQKIPVIGAFDFEAKMTPGLGKTTNSQNIASHKIVSFSMVLLTADNEIIFESYESDEDLCLALFIEAIDKVNKIITDAVKEEVPIRMTWKQQGYHDAAELCYICLKIFDYDYKVRDHCHFTGSYFGPAHNVCNLQRKQNFKVPMYAHNFSGYDSHFLLQAISRHASAPKLRCMAYNSQRIRTLTYNKINFIDSMHFISDSLDNITKDLVASGHEFDILKKSGLYDTEEQQKLLLRKGVFPYELLTSLKKFQNMTTFPPIEDFYSRLYERNVSKDDYLHGKAVYKAFKCNNMADYLRLYNILDVYLLLEGLTAFRNVGWKEFGLDSAHFISLPQYGFQW